MRCEEAIKIAMLDEHMLRVCVAAFEIKQALEHLRCCGYCRQPPAILGKEEAQRLQKILDLKHS